MSISRSSSSTATLKLPFVPLSRCQHEGKNHHTGMRRRACEIERGHSALYMLSMVTNQLEPKTSLCPHNVHCYISFTLYFTSLYRQQNGKIVQCLILCRHAYPAKPTVSDQHASTLHLLCLVLLRCARHSGLFGHLSPICLYRRLIPIFEMLPTHLLSHSMP